MAKVGSEIAHPPIFDARSQCLRSLLAREQANFDFATSLNSAETSKILSKIVLFLPNEGGLFLDLSINDIYN